MSEEQEYEGYQAAEPVPYIPYASPSQQPPFSSPADAAAAAHSFSTPSPSEVAAPESLPPVGKSRRRFWIIIGVLSVLLLLVLASLTSFFVITYLNRSTPTKTLDAFCNALQHEDYRSAYDLFSKKVQGTFTESLFAAILSRDKITACTHGSPNDSGTSVTTSLKLLHASHNVNNDNITLVKDSNNDWKIDDVSQQASA